MPPRVNSTKKAIFWVKIYLKENGLAFWQSCHEKSVGFEPELSSNGARIESVRLNKINNLFRPIGQTFGDETSVRLKKVKTFSQTRL